MRSVKVHNKWWLCVCFSYTGETGKESITNLLTSYAITPITKNENTKPASRKVHILTQHTARHMRLFRAVIRGLWSCCSACSCLSRRPRSLYTTWPKRRLLKDHGWVHVFFMFGQFDRWCKCNCLCKGRASSVYRVGRCSVTCACLASSDLSFPCVNKGTKGWRRRLQLKSRT